ncbi:MAG: NAD-dependent epimerase/dehydratase family protein [Sphaerochaeta sp.]
MKTSYDLYLITGASGFLGKVLVRSLLDRGKRVRVLVLRGDPSEKELPREAEITYGSVTEPDSMKAFFEGDLSHACLVHCAGIISIASTAPRYLWDINVNGSRNVMEACIRYGVAKAVHVSSVHAIPEKPKGKIMSEVSVFTKKSVRGKYAKSKAEATGLVLDYASKGLNVSVVLPSGILGPYDEGRGNIASAIISFCNRRLPLAVKGGYDFVDVRDVVQGIFECSEKGRAGECYILSGHYLTLKDILGHLSRLGYGKEPVYLPLAFVKIISPFCELAGLLRRKPLFLTPYSAYTLGTNSMFSHAKAQRELGYAPRKIQVTLNSMVNWLKKKKRIPEIKELS